MSARTTQEFVQIELLTQPRTDGRWEAHVTSSDGSSALWPSVNGPTAALTIHGVEARHAAYLNRLQGESPFPEAVNPTLTPDQVLAAAAPFIVG